MNEIYIFKRNGMKVLFDRQKIINAITKANNEMEDLDAMMSEHEIEDVAASIEYKAREKLEDYSPDSDDSAPYLSVEEIQDMVETFILTYGYYYVAKAYIIYRYTRKINRDINELDESVLKLIDRKNEKVQDENANKNANVIYTQRDLIAGETSKYLSRKMLIPNHIVEAHDKGQIHFHDMDYYVQKSFNCCLVNIRDMLDNGTVINDKMIETPKSFQTACTVMTQIITAVSSSQYGGTSVDISALGKYLKRSEDKFRKKILDKHPDFDENTRESLVSMMLEDEMKAGCQTIQYQINTMATTNGQSPFVTLFMYLKNGDEYIDYNAMIFEEMFKQRILGIKNKVGVYISPSFPKLVYVLTPQNNLSGGKFDYVTKLACKCVAKRMMPDFISEKQMKENYSGGVFSPMGCRSFLSPWKDSNGEYKWEGRLTA